MSYQSENPHRSSKCIGRFIEIDINLQNILTYFHKILNLNFAVKPSVCCKISIFTQSVNASLGKFPFQHFSKI